MTASVSSTCTNFVLMKKSVYIPILTFLGTPYNSLSCETRTISYSDESPTRTIQNSKDTVSSSVNLKYHDAPVEIPHLPPSSDSDGRTLSSGPSRIGSIDEVPIALEGNQSKMSHPTRTLYYPNLEKCVSLEADLQVNLLIVLFISFQDFSIIF